MHQKAEQEVLKEAQKDPLLDNLIEQLKGEVANGKPVTKEEIDELINTSQNLDLAGNVRTKKVNYNLQDLDNDEGLKNMLQRRA